MVQTLELRATQDGIIWPRRPLVSSKGLLSCIKNLPISSYDKRPTSFRAVSFNVSGDLLAATDARGRVYLFYVTTNRYSLVQHLGSPTIHCCFSPKRKTELLVTCEDETVRCIDVQSQTLISTLRGHRLPVRCASFQQSGHLALTASQDAVILWDTKDWSRYRVLNAGPGVEEALFVDHEDLVAVCFQDDTIVMWELDSLALKYRFSLPEKEQSPGLRKIAVSNDHQVVVASGRAPYIYVWGLESQTILRIIELPSPIKQVVKHAFLPGFNAMISILADDGSVFFLDVAAKHPQIKVEISNQGRKIVTFDIECHARYLAASTSDGFLLLYDLDIARETAARAQERRRKEGLIELEQDACLRTRSGLYSRFSVDEMDPIVDLKQVDTSGPEQSRPVPSKLIDSLFGAKHPRKITKQTPSGATATKDSDFTRQHPVSASVQAATRSFSVPTKDLLGKDVRALQDKAQTRHSNPLRSPTQLTARELEVNRKRLVGSLKCNGMYPKKYRVLVWRFLLRLPKNEEAFRSLVAKGKHPVFVRLKDDYPLQDSRLFRRLHRILSAIVYWCPAFGEVSYLPALVYPFVKIFRENDLAAFEASISVILHWCRDFLVCLPYPPVFALSAIEKEVARRDTQLYDHFVRYQVTSEAYAWSLLRTIFTEVLSEDEWMCLWDHLFTFSDTPQLVFVAVLAYLSYFRTALLAACDRFSIEQFFHQQNAIDMQKFVQLMTNLREKLQLSDFTAIEDPAATTQGHGPLWPLSRGQYPAFTHYPRFVVDFQISERHRIALEEAELAHKQTLLHQIEEESKKLKTEHEKWLKERKVMIEAEERRRKEAIAAEKERVLRLKTLDICTRKRRLEHLRHMESSAQDTLEEASKMLQCEYQRLEGTLATQKERIEFELSSRKEEENLLRIESETHERVRGIYKQREMEERLVRLRTEFETRVKQQELQDLLKFQSWKREDQEHARKEKIQLHRREEDALQSQENRVRQELEKQLLAQQLAKDKEVLELETARYARRKKQQKNAELDPKTTVHDDDGLVVQEHTGRSRARTQRNDEIDSSHHSQESTHRQAGTKDAVDGICRDHRNREDAFDCDRKDPLQRRNVPANDETRGNTCEESEPHPRTRDDVVNTFATPTRMQKPLSSESSASFASLSMQRTMAEMSLLEKALGNFSSSMSSSESIESHERGDAGADDGGSVQSEESRRSFTTRKVTKQEQNAAKFSTPPTGKRLTDHGLLPSEKSAVGPETMQTLSQEHEEDMATPQEEHKFAQAEEEEEEEEEEEVPFASMENDDVPSTPRAVVDFPQRHESDSSPVVPRHFSLVQEEDGHVSLPQTDRVCCSRMENHELSTPQAATRKDFNISRIDLISPSNSKAVEQDAAPAIDINGHSTNDSDSDNSIVMDAMQRPIAELEKKLGIRFDDFSDEEKEDESLDDSFDDLNPSEEDETIEDDRAKLLQRAKRLLELSSFDTDSDEDLSLRY